MPARSSPTSAQAPELSTAQFRVHGLDCAEEASLIRRNLGGAAGIRQLGFDVLHGKMTVAFDPAGTDEAAIAQAVSALGLECRPWAEPAAGQSFLRRRASDLLLLLGGVSLALGLTQQAVQSGDWFAALDHRIHDPGEYRLAIVCFLAAIVSTASQFAPKGIRALVGLRPEMNALVLVSTIGAGVLGEWAEGATLSFLFVLAGRLEGWSVDRARREVGGLVASAPQHASVVEGETERRVAVDLVSVGSLVRVRPGESIPCDGTVESGTSGVNEAVLTGEAVPAPKAPGDAVFAGSFNGDGVLDIRTTKPVDDTRLARIVRMVEESQHRRAPAERYVDRFAQFYTPIMFAVAVLVAAGPPLLLGASFETWFYRGMLALLISCPCALVISTPVAIAAATASATRRGLLIKGGAYLEEAARVQAIAFDKTGVLTLGEPGVDGIEPLGDREAREVLARMAGVEHYSEHPLAQAIVRHARDQGVEPAAADDFHALHGKGASAVVSGERFWIGNARMLRDQGVFDGTDASAELREALDSGDRTVVVCGRGEEPWAIVRLSDSIRPDAREAIARLRALKVGHIAVLSGDNAASARRVGSALGIEDVRANLLPEDKTAVVRELRERYGSVAMVGDGINDAEALIAASLGVGVGGRGTDIALESADAILMAPRIQLLPDLIATGRRALRIIRQNVFLALAFKALFLVLAAQDLATLWLAVAADMGATILVVFNGLRLLRTDSDA